MKQLSTLKTLPLAAVMAMGLSLTPAITLADDGDRGRHKEHHGQQKEKPRHYNHGHQHRDYDRHESRNHPKWKRHELKHVIKHDIRNRDHHEHYHRQPRDQRYIIVPDYGHQHYLGLNDLRFIFGLHTDNVDIIFRD